MGKFENLINAAKLRLFKSKLVSSSDNSIDIINEEHSPIDLKIADSVLTNIDNKIDAKQGKLHFLNINKTTCPMFGAIYNALSGKQDKIVGFIGHFAPNEIIYRIEPLYVAALSTTIFILRYLDANGIDRNVECAPLGADSTSTTALPSTFNLLVIYTD